LLLSAFACLSQMQAQTINGTIRGKYEYQTEEQEGRFEVRTARVSVKGDLTNLVSYKAEIDLCDEGSIKMLDAYARLNPAKDWHFTIGQMRVPFTIDAHRSPHEQYFANRSFIAKQVGNVRDVGATLDYTIPLTQSEHASALTLKAGLFNGSGLTNQKNYWTKSVNYSAKAELQVPLASLYKSTGVYDFRGLCLVLSSQKIKPDGITVMEYDAGIYFQTARWHIEAEYLLKTYGHDAFQNVSAVDAFVSYSLPMRSKMLKTITPLVRYDYMGDHSDGTRNEDTGLLQIDDYQRSRLTAGVTLGLLRGPLQTDLRLNYEKYFYRDDAEPLTSERDKVVAELVVRF